MSTQPELTEHKITVLLIDDQPMIGEAVRRMLLGETDLTFHYCRDAAKAVETANNLAPTVILQDLVMPEIDGLDLVNHFRANEATKETPLIVLSTKEEPTTKAEAFSRGANDYLVKLPDKLELVARIRYHSKGYINLLQRNEAYRALKESQRVLAEDVAQAAKYLQSLLPEKLKRGPVRADWRFIPSAALGGDCFGYHALDDEHFVLYLLDVCGHGVGAALLSVSALNALRSQSLPQTDFRKPDQVLNALNRAFPMEQQNGKFFTIWYGVYNTKTRQLDHAGGGHPPVLLVSGPAEDQLEVKQLESQGPMIGAVEDLEFRSETIQVGPCAKLFLYSDGIYEIEQKDGRMWPFDDFVKVLGEGARPGTSDLDRFVAQVRSIGGRDDFVDDFSIVEFDFPTSN
ncbi:SpoIIE family protein phosphatase [Singulisphaera sp. PoT]|uniref:SpoIIE family protein phosphatase n=1 Tax=Singulisphaera sp. PoT TaxID=3411797 RepID=UPI003BF566C3